MKTLAASLCEEDFINLSADISTLESLLKKDGLAGDNRLSQFKGGATDEWKQGFIKSNWWNVRKIR